MDTYLLPDAFFVMQGKRQYNEYSQGRRQQQQGGYEEGEGDVAMKRARGPRGGKKQRRQQGGEEGVDGDEAMHNVEVRPADAWAHT
jgi:hypothetical protein